MNLFDSKLVLRVNRYKTTQINSRNGDSANIAMVDQAPHAELCVYWNRVYARLQGAGAVSL